MANRRMFSKDIVQSDPFLDMPDRSQNLYFQLNMEADDDGFIGNVKKVLRSLGFSSEELKTLTENKFVISFPDGVIVIKHFFMNNQIRKDRYKPTTYQKHKNSLYIDENGAYSTTPQPTGNHLATNGKPLGNQLATQNSIGKDSIDKNIYTPSFLEFFSAYPKQVGKAGAFKEWERIVQMVDPQAIIDGLKKQIKHNKFDENEKFIKDPETWLAKGCWEDKLEIKSVEKKPYAPPPSPAEYSDEERARNKVHMENIKKNLNFKL